MSAAPRYRPELVRLDPKGSPLSADCVASFAHAGIVEWDELDLVLMASGVTAEDLDAWTERGQRLPLDVELALYDLLRSAVERAASE